MELGVLWGISGDLINMRAHMRRVVVAVAAICIAQEATATSNKRKLFKSF